MIFSTNKFGRSYERSYSVFRDVIGRIYTVCSRCGTIVSWVTCYDYVGSSAGVLTTECMGVARLKGDETEGFILESFYRLETD